jgi:hypothetical protein
MVPELGLVVVQTVSLLGDGNLDSHDGKRENVEESKPTPAPIVSYWNPELTLYMIHDNFTFQLGHTPLTRYAMRMLVSCTVACMCFRDFVLMDL